MKTYFCVGALLALSALAGCNDDDDNNSLPTALATLEAKSGSNLAGSAAFTQLQDNSVVMKLTVRGVTPGEHAVHLHQNGDCSGNGAEGAGGHWNPTNQAHGRRGTSANFHRGDIGNMTVGSDGTGTIELTVSDWRLGGSDATMNILNKSVIVHAGADDYTSQPSGNSGVNIGCGVITQQ